MSTVCARQSLARIRGRRWAASSLNLATNVPEALNPKRLK
jgi:hypothetical protein